jgi:ComEC/Rec2-related protein
MLFPWAFCLYLVGLGAAGKYPLHPVQMVVLIVAGAAGAILMRRYRVASVILVLCFMPLGMLLRGAEIEREQSGTHHPIYGKYGLDSPLRIYGEVLGGPFDIYGKSALLMRAHVIESRGEFNNVDARLLVFHEDEGSYFAVGDGVAFDCLLGDESRYLDSPPVKKLRMHAWCRAQRRSMVPYELSNVIGKGFSGFKESLFSHLRHGLEGDYISLYQGVVFGKEATGLSRRVRDYFYDAGISHLVVASGAQVALIIFPFFTIYGKLRSRWIRALLFILMGAAMIVLYFIVGHASSILRAISVGFVVLIGHAIGRPTHALNSLALAGLIWLIVEPGVIEDASFLLSYSASFGILYMAPIIVSWLESRFPRALRGAGTRAPAHWKVYFWIKRNLIHLGIITIASQWGVMPIIAWKFNRVSFNGLLANLVAVPAGSIVLILGALSGVAGFIHPLLSLGLNYVALPFLWVMMSVAKVFGGLDPWSFENVRPHLIVVVAYYIVTILVIEAVRRGADVLALASRAAKGDLDMFDE